MQYPKTKHLMLSNGGSCYLRSSQNIYFHLGKQYTPITLKALNLLAFYTYKILCVCLFVWYLFPKPPKLPGSCNFGSRPNLSQLKTCRSPIFEILIFKGGSPYGPVLKKWVFRGFFRKSQPFQHIGLWNFDKVNIFRQKNVQKIFPKNSHF